MTYRTIDRGPAILILGFLMALGACSTMPSERGARDAVVKHRQHCVDQTVQVYFEPFSAEVTKEGRAVLAAAANQAKPCVVTGVDVRGLADAVGDPNANLELSKRRAEAVTNALAAAGLPAAEFKLAAVGQQGAVTPAGQTRPLRRRADIVLHLAPAS